MNSIMSERNGTAIQVFKYEKGKYRFDVKTFTKIMSTSKDNLVAVYSMSGPLRLGKSFMLGFFVRYMTANGVGDWISTELKNPFKYRSGSERETTGIWMWSEPFIVENREGKKVSVFLLDTQGCFDNKTSMQENAIVFALSTLLSSVMIFNIQRQLSEDMLQFLQYFANFARLADEENNDEPFQRLLFLIRDWQFDDFEYGYYDDNTGIDGKNFKTQALDIGQDMPKDVKFVHESILSTFDDVSFYLMPHPGNTIARGGAFDVRKVDEDFLEHLKQLVPLVLNRDAIVAKKIGGEYITGAQLIRFVERWAEIFQSDAIPEAKTVFEATADLHNQMAMSAAIDKYARSFKERVNNSDGIPEPEFLAFKDALTLECIELFKSFKRLGGKEYEDKYMALLRDELNKRCEYYSEMNATNCRYARDLADKAAKITGLEQLIADSVRQMGELSAGQQEERERYMKAIADNQKQLSEWKDKYEEAQKGKDEEMQRLKDELSSQRRTGLLEQLATIIPELINTGLNIWAHKQGAATSMHTSLSFPFPTRESSPDRSGASSSVPKYPPPPIPPTVSPHQLFYPRPTISSWPPHRLPAPGIQRPHQHPSTHP